MTLEHWFGHIAEDARRRRSWISSLAPLFDVDTDAVVPSTAFHRCRHLGKMVLADFDTPAQVIWRTTERVAAQGLDHLLLRVHASDRFRVSTGGEPVEADPLDIFVIDLSRPIRIETPAGAGIALVMPRRLFADDKDELSGWHGRVMFNSVNPVTGMLVDHIRNLGRCADNALPNLLRHLTSATTVPCKALAMAAREASGLPARPSHEVATGVAVRRVIEEHLVDVDVPMLTARFGPSRTPFYRLFVGEGGDGKSAFGIP